MQECALCSSEAFRTIQVKGEAISICDACLKAALNAATPKPPEPEPDPDRPGVVATDGVDPEYKNQGAPKPINPATGQHESYWVLSEEERAKGFVRPLRQSYIHDSCGTVTRMSSAIAETYARDPKFYGATFCVGCGGHYPVGPKGEFRWVGPGGRTGKRVGE